MDASSNVDRGVDSGANPDAGDGAGDGAGAWELAATGVSSEHSAISEEHAALLADERDDDIVSLIVFTIARVKYLCVWGRPVNFWVRWRWRQQLEFHFVSAPLVLLSIHTILYAMRRVL